MLNTDIVHLLKQSRECEIQSLRHLLATSRMIGLLRGIIHALQRERGATSFFLVTGGAMYVNRLQRYRQEVEQAALPFRERLTQSASAVECHPSSSQLYALLALAVHGLSHLPELRSQVDEQQLDAPQAMASFNELIRHMLAAAFEAAAPVAKPGITGALVALLNFMQGKELAGQERAIGVIGFSRGWAGGELRTALVNRIDAQERCFQLFTEFADGDSLAAWQALISSGVTAELERSRRMALTMHSEPGAGTEMAQLWFDQATQRIDALKALEDRLEQQLLDVCEQQVQIAESEWVDDEARIAELAGSCPVAVPQGVLLGRPVDASAPDVLLELAQEQVEGRSVYLGRALLDLLQTQSRRLHNIEDELRSAREALEERKLVEKAKAVLIKHRAMSEEEAYRALRKMAMNQGKRLVEVASATVAMADILGAQF